MVIEILIFRMKSFWMKTNRLDPILNDGVHHILMHLTWLNHGWLVVSNMNFIFHFRHGMSSFPLTTSLIFQRGRAQPPTSHGYFHILGRIIPTDELIFFKMVIAPPTRWCSSHDFMVTCDPQDIQAIEEGLRTLPGVMWLSMGSLVRSCSGNFTKETSDVHSKNDIGVLWMFMAYL